MRAARLLVLLAVLVAAAPAAAADDPYAGLLAPPGLCPQDDALSLDHGAAARSMLCLTNYARERSGLRPLVANAVLDAAGQDKLAADLSCREFSHTPCNQPFRTVFSAYVEDAGGYRIGENIAWGTGRYGAPRATMELWLHSAGHRENILTPEYRELGVGYRAGETFLGYDGATLWSQEFGTRTSAPAGARAQSRHGRAHRRHR